MGSKRKINSTNRQMERESIFREKEIEFKKSGKYKPQKNSNRNPQKRKKKKTRRTTSSRKNSNGKWVLNYLPKRESDD
ncbi:MULTISPECIES: hypothetical protein [Streptococcus anginosus group]|uniref:hypothetical protein n=1 Tax=Streptococcus anginosus group TaxID=671232 RepID=UPI0020016A17|nr:MULTISPECIES: hypothetical protein [Streptococcus anginosus group]MCW1056180.1 hypothetical protein [Streptococcus anginosus]